MSGWSNIQAKDELDSLDESIPEAPVYPKPDIETKVLDLASEAEDKKQYVVKEGEEKPFEKRKRDGFQVAEPVNIYEPGFRSDLYEGLQKYFREKREEKDRVERIRKKIGLR